jgi:type I restriction-modification system DNA methylase subunit
LITKEEAKKEIKHLIEKYNRIKEAGKIKSYNESMTKNQFIEPLFMALGWDIHNIKIDDEVTKEEKISKGRVDYAFRLNSIPKFFLEAKSLKTDLDLPKWAEQATNYAWHKGVIWSILCDFEGIKIFNSEVRDNNYREKLFFQLKYNNYLNKFDQLWLLSRESFEEGLLNKEAEKWGKKLKKIPIDKQLLNDFNDFRNILTKNILSNNKNLNLSEEDIDDAVQKLLSRMLFIRKCEDLEIESKELITIRETSREYGKYKKLTDVIFRYYDNQYDSELFRPFICDQLLISNKTIEEVINGLYRTKDKIISYDFSAIDADILGNVYEQYLGHILKKIGRGTRLKKGETHRKEQGIYYTPTHIVDFIVKNTLGVMLKNKKIEVKNLKILDPACGSGSFLIKTFDLINEYYKKKTKIDSPFVKDHILKNNIFGVDIDSKAIEIARLNLLLKTIEKRHKLPTLEKNIKIGNSLINDPEISGHLSFNWKDKFPEIINSGGFDIIIGNPPYVFSREKIKQEEKDFFSKNFVTSEYQPNTYIMFIEKSIKLLKEGGMLGFIVPDAWLRVESAKKLRKFILENTFLECVINIRGETFSDVGVEASILILKKTKKYKMTKIYTDFKNLKFMNVSQHEWLKNDNFEIDIFSNNNIKNILNKIERKSEKLDSVSLIKAGLQAYEKGKGTPKQTKEDVLNRPYDYNYKFNENTYKYLEGKNIKRYGLTWKSNWLKYGKWLAAPRKFELFNSPRILVREIPAKPPYSTVASYAEDIFLNNRSIINILNKNKDIDLKYILSIINSKIITFYHMNKSVKAKRDLFPKITLNDLRKFPIIIISSQEQQYFIKNVDKLIYLNNNLRLLDNKKTNERTRLEKEIKSLNDDMNKKIYKLYNLTQKEIEVIEESFK